MIRFRPYLVCSVFLSAILILCSCEQTQTTPTDTPSPISTVTSIPTEVPTSALTATAPIATLQPGFIAADGSRPLTFPADFGAHSDFRTEWWYYTGNLQTADARHFGFELTIFRVGLVPPSADLPSNSQWTSREIYFAHFAISDVADDHFHAFQRYSRPGPGLAGAESNPYRVWLEDWNITETTSGVYHLQAEQDGIALNLTLTDELGVVLNGEKGYSRKGQNPTNASYYYSQPRLRADGSVSLSGAQYSVSGFAWNDHEFSTGVLDPNQIGWDWFSLQFDNGPALMLFQLRQRDGEISASASGTFVPAPGASQSLHKSDFSITVLDHWTSPHTQGVYPSAWDVQLLNPACQLHLQPWMPDQEINFPPITYWEGAVHFEGTCNGQAVRGNGYVELTGYIGNLPLP